MYGRCSTDGQGEGRKMDVSKEIDKIKGMKEEDFEAWINERRSEIYSFGGMFPPGNAERIGMIRRETDIYFYYMAEDGELYYETASGYAFKKKMAAFRNR